MPAAELNWRPPTARQLSDWRTYPPTKHLEKFQVVVPDRSKCITSMACHQKSPLLAVSSASHDKNLYIIKYSPPPNANSSVIDQPYLASNGHNSANAEVFSLVSSYQNTYPVFDLCWSGDRLLAACGNNYLQLFQLDKETGSLSVRTQYPHVIHQHSQFPSPPGRYHQSNRVQSVQFQPGDGNSTRFIATENCNLRMWDAGRTEAPLVSCKVSDDLLLCAQWGTEVGSSLVACAGIDSSLLVMDMRLTGAISDDNLSKPMTSKSPIVWFRDKAHLGAVRSVQWSPFLPYWLATGGDDHLVNIWDMRSTRGPMVRIDGNRRAVNSIAWSQSHGDWLTTGSGDCSWRLWNIRSNHIVMTSAINSSENETMSHSWLHLGNASGGATAAGADNLNGAAPVEYLVGAIQLAECGQDGFASSVVSVANSPIWCDAHFAVSSTGELACIGLLPDAYNSWVPHRQGRITGSKSIASDLETHAYRRDFVAAMNAIVTWSSSARNIEKNSELREMINLTIQNFTAQYLWHFADDPSSSVNSSAPDKLGVNFTADLFKSATDPIDLISNLYYASRIAGATNMDQQEMSAARSKLSLNARTVLDQTGKHPLIDSNIDYLEEFRRDLDSITKLIPALFRRHQLTKAAPESLQSQFDLLCLRLELVEMVDGWRHGYLYLPDKSQEIIYLKLYRMLPKIIDATEKSPQLISARLLHRLTEIVICEDRVHGLEFGRKVVELYERLDRANAGDVKFSNAVSICHLLLYPTVFDTSAGDMLPKASADSAFSSAETSYDSLAMLRNSAEYIGGRAEDEDAVPIIRSTVLDTILLNSKTAVPLIKLEHRLHKLIPKLYQLSTEPASDQWRSKQAAAIIEEIGIQRSISAATNMLYLNALLAAKKFDSYFAVAAELIMTYASYEFSQSLCGHLEKAAMVQFQKYADEICSVKAGTSERLSVMTPVLLMALKTVLLMPKIFSQRSVQNAEHEGTVQQLMLYLGRMGVSVYRQLWKQCLQWVDSAVSRSLGDTKARLNTIESMRILLESVDAQITSNNSSVANSAAESRQTAVAGIMVTEPSREVTSDKLLRLDDWGVKQWNLQASQQISEEIYHWLGRAKLWLEKLSMRCCFNAAAPVTLVLAFLTWTLCYYVGRNRREKQLSAELQKYESLLTPTLRRSAKRRTVWKANKPTILSSVVVVGNGKLPDRGSETSLLSSDQHRSDSRQLKADSGRMENYIHLDDLTILKTSSEKNTLTNKQLAIQPFDSSVTSRYGQSPILRVPEEMLISFESDVKLVSKVAEGGGGAVWRAELLSETLQSTHKCKSVAVKVLKPSRMMRFADLKAATYYELAVMKLLSHHPNIIRLIGYTEEPLSITTQMCECSLHSLVSARPQYATLTTEYDSMAQYIARESRLKGLLIQGFEMLPEIALHLAWSIASGMAEMHRFNILHRDLKSANILVDRIPIFAGQKQPWTVAEQLAPVAQEISGLMGQNSLAGGLGWSKDLSKGKPYCPLSAVIIDFGLAKVVRAPGERAPANSLADLNSVGISYHYAAPEAFDRLYFKGDSAKEEGKPVDVFSFGMTCWEMLERRVPFHKLANKEIEAKVKGGLRPAISAIYRDFNNLPDNNRHYQVLVKCIRQCWKQNPRDRPTFDDLKRKLRPFWLGPEQQE